MSSAVEAEVAGVFVNTKEGTTIRTTLEELGYPQPPTPVHVDNTTAVGIENDTVKQRRSKAIDMRFYWIRDRVKQGQFHIYWAPGKHNIADYFTKHQQVNIINRNAPITCTLDNLHHATSKLQCLLT
jgi:hypothetical protein